MGIKGLLCPFVVSPSCPGPAGGQSDRPHQASAGDRGDGGKVHYQHAQRHYPSDPKDPGAAGGQRYQRTACMCILVFVSILSHVCTEDPGVKAGGLLCGPEAFGEGFAGLLGASGPVSPTPATTHGDSKGRMQSC